MLWNVSSAPLRLGVVTVRVGTTVATGAGTGVVASKVKLFF